MFTVNIILLCFFAIKTIVEFRKKDGEFRLYLSCLVTSSLAVLYFFLMAKMSGFIMIGNGGEIYKEYTVPLNILMIIVAAGYFALVIQPVIRIAAIRRKWFLKADKNVDRN